MTEHSTLTTLPDLRETTSFIRAIHEGEVTLEFPNEGRPAVLLQRRRVTSYERYVKPVIDRIGGAALLVLLLPVMLLVALLVRATLGPGVLYRQERVGRGGEVFTIAKFRTMRHDRRRRRGDFDGPDRRRTHKTLADPRHTDLGRFLRATSLDELPQLWNVVRGDMSLVGPRPELVEIVENYADWQHRRHDVKPGMTGLWQVTERSEEGDMHLHVATDLVYVRNVSLLTDLRLLALTLPAVLGSPVRPRGRAELSLPRRAA